MPTTPTPDDFLALRADWKAAGRPGPDSGHPYWDAPTGPAGPAECLTGLVPAWAVALTDAMAPAMRAESDANVAAMLRR